MTLLDPDVIERAVEDALRGSSGGTGPRSPISEAVFSHVCREVEQAVREQAPVIAAAAYRQGREGLEARIEAKAGELDAMAQAQADEFGNYITSAGGSGEYKEGRADAYDDAAELLRSLLTDKEGEK